MKHLLSILLLISFIGISSLSHAAILKRRHARFTTSEVLIAPKGLIKRKGIFQSISSINIFKAIKKGKIEDVKTYIQKYDGYHPEYNKNIQSPLYFAVAQEYGERNLEIIKLLAEAEMKYQYDYQSIPRVLKYLLNNSLKVAVKNQTSDNRTVATPELEEVEKIARILIDTGINVNPKDHYGNTFLLNLLKHSYQGNSELVKHFIKAGADVNARNDKGETPLHRAAEGLDSESIKLLIEAGAKVNARNENGETPLDYAARNGDTKKIRFLIKQGAKTKNKLSSTSLQTTCAGGFSKAG